MKSTVQASGRGECLQHDTFGRRICAASDSSFACAVVGQPRAMRSQGARRRGGVEAAISVRERVVQSVAEHLAEAGHLNEGSHTTQQAAGDGQRPRPKDHAQEDAPAAENNLMSSR